MNSSPLDAPVTRRDSAWTVFLVFLRLGLSSFGGPVAHLGYFRTEFVQRRAWLSEAAYAELIALCQFLPGPASSQVGFALGWSRAGLAGALGAWLGFTLPSALILIALAMGLSGSGTGLPGGLVHGLKIVAVAVVAQALWGMARVLCRGPLRMLITLVSAISVLLWPTTLGQVCVMLLAGMIGAGLLQPTFDQREDGLAIAVGKRTGYLALVLFALLLAGLPLLAGLWPSLSLLLADGFYRAGALVFGGGHVVLPLLQSEVVAPGLLSNDLFLAGYAAAQAVPGPLFSFSAFLGAAIDGWRGALVCLVMIFLPAMLLIVGVLPFWQHLRHLGRVQAALAGVNAAVVGLLAAALYDPLWTSSILKPLDLGLALLALAALMCWKLPPWLVVLAGGAAGLLLGA
ncbi:MULTISPECIES: chromate efflux transporter [Pseudomonas]|uniref:chromate efflux transporter n=1 Tax=Pseudomonas TaxID=286 RepID=UPI000B350F80|nr:MULTISPECIES: chromate efflux transporter [Pseudomonas]PMY60551.1 chromate transporter [Pseudomonas sp. FW305-25]PMY74305.1 chromate transporter [Pseudomonas sp. FW126-L8]PNA74831.1 chromate transporter [Pseudomonas sp. FW305-76]